MTTNAHDVLLVIDVQNDFCPGGRLAVAGGDLVVPVIHSIAPRFEHIILTQDWHPPDHHSFASAHPGKEPYDQTEMPYGIQTLWPDHCVQGTRGAPYPRGTDSAQGFPPPDRFVLRIFRERPRDGHRAGRLSARARPRARVPLRPGVRLLRGLLGAGCAAAGI
jgi:nicotinamidase-related amidase